ncbi:hypothetical protein [Vibrio phage VP4B]|uniref:Uncharacterized protein n=1 Tax=Vibrio phage VP4B TaxID=1262540 RepID=V9LZF4_9CAUD|nr:hypothetical protein FDJ61_gp133 [Vibrio phage VP4B]AGB07247.1 hypothetical protein [Vibrio phage VP4B]
MKQDQNIFTTKYASKFEQEIVKQEPTHYKLYLRILNFDYWFRESDCNATWRGGLESEKEILESLDQAKDHPDYYILQELWASNGDRGLLSCTTNPFEIYAERYKDESMGMYHFLKTLDLLGITETQAAEMLRAARFIARFLLERESMESFLPVYPNYLVYTPHLGGKREAGRYTSKMALSNKLHRFMNKGTERVTWGDFDAFGRLCSIAGTTNTTQFNADPDDERELLLCYIKGCYFSAPFYIHEELRTKISRTDLRFIRLVRAVLSNTADISELRNTKYTARV